MIGTIRKATAYTRATIPNKKLLNGTYKGTTLTKKSTYQNNTKVNPLMVNNNIIRTIVQPKTRLTVQDNSGAKVVECIRVLRSKKERGVVGSMIVVAVKKSKPDMKVKKHEVHRAVVTLTKRRVTRPSGVRFWAADVNMCVIVDENGQPLGTRVVGPVPEEIRRKYPKVAAIAQAVF
mmetsp:Transcript_5836/g.8570  ORF Transcript_5836/g.8570 Transcript_5836/m.8570 type:complete len:177 (-) Transcript_5836:37-567(-)